MATVSLDATMRTDTGKGAARKLRAKGRLPAVVYRVGQDATAISILPEAIELAFQKTKDRNTLVELVMEGQPTRTCIVREAQRNPLSRRLEHVDFYQVEPDESVVVKVDVNPVGIAAATKIGGRLRIWTRTLQVRCKPADIPATIDIDVTEMLVGEFWKVSQITPPPGCELVADRDFNVVGVLGKPVPAGAAAGAPAAAGA